MHCLFVFSISLDLTLVSYMYFGDAIKKTQKTPQINNKIFNKLQ